MKKNDDKKVAIKLINHYADQYKRVEEEKQSLQLEIKDLKMNLKINKEIIDGLFKHDAKDKTAMVYAKSQEEITLLTKRNEQLSKELSSSRDKIIYYEQILNDSIMQYRESTESLFHKIFILDNVISKKDHLLIMLSNKLTKLIEKNFNNNDNPVEEHEIYVIEPSASVNIIHEDLMLYKQAYENALQKMRETSILIEKHEAEIDRLKLQINKMTSYDLQNNPREKEIIKENSAIDSSYVREDFSKKNDNIKKCVTNCNYSQIVKSIPEVGVNRQNWETDEWNEILKSVNLSPEELEKLSKNKLLTKLIEAIELLNKVIMERNMQIRLLSQENENLNQKNSLLNNDNISLTKTVFQLKNEIQSLKDNFRSTQFSTKSKTESREENPGYLNTNISMVGNTSREEKKNAKYCTQSIARYYDDYQQKSIRLNHSFTEEKIASIEGEYQVPEEKNLTEVYNDESDIIEVKLNDDIIEEIKKKNRINVYSEQVKVEKKSTPVCSVKPNKVGYSESQSENDSVIHTQKKEEEKQTVNTIESYTSGNYQKLSGFISSKTDFEKLNIQIKNSKV